MQEKRSLRKIVSPAVSPTILHREALVKKLNDALTGVVSETQERLPDYKLILLYAPAGYGKTTLLADLAQHTTIPCSWYILERTDTDKLTFLKFVIKSIRHCFPQFGTALDALIANIVASDINRPINTSYFDAVVDALATAMNTEISERFALFLCNYQEVNENIAINDVVNQLLQKVSSHFILIVESRVIPNFDFSYLLTYREMLSMSSKQLRFAAQDIYDLARIQGVVSLSYSEAEQLAASFAGWIAGIILGTHLSDMQFLYTHCQGRQYLFAYVVNEVFRHETNIYPFLKEAAILQQMTPSLCSELLCIPDASSRLQYLEQRGLFVTHFGDGSHITYTCHPILRDLLCEELRRETPERFLLLHRRAAEILAVAHDYEQAIYHALEAHADDVTVHLILEVHEEIFAQGHVETLARWIDTLSAATTANHPLLLLIRANIFLLRGEYPVALSLLDTASEILVHQPSVIESANMPQLQSAITIARSKALFQAGKYCQARDLCQRVLEQVAVDEIALHAEARTRLGICFNLLGNFSAGIAQLQKALQLWGRHMIRRQVADVHSALASAYSLIGNFVLAEHHQSCANTCWEHLHDEWGKINSLIRMGLIKQRRGAYAEAEHALTQALTRARGPLRFQRGEVYALVNLGELFLDQGCYDQALAFTENGLALARYLRDSYVVNCSLSQLAMTYLLIGDISTALLLLSEIEEPKDQDNTTSYYYVLREITYGTILLYQERYEDAAAYLAKIEGALETISLKREQLQVKVRLAVCYLALKQTLAVNSCLKEIATLLAIYENYEYLVLMEVRRHPKLLQSIEMVPEARQLRSLLHLEEVDVQEIYQPDSISSPLIAHQGEIRIVALGEPAIFVQEKPITRWRTARAMELCFFLLDCGCPMRKEQIITALWPEVDEQTDHTFHTTLYYLRKALGRTCVVVQSGTYTLNLAALYGDQVRYDVEAFQKHQTRAKQALVDADDTRARNELLAMIDLYRGEYVQSFYSDWCGFRRNELRNAYLDARCSLAHIAGRREEFDESVMHWQHMLAVDTCQEEAHYGIMRCYVRQGKRGLALRQYQHCKEILQQELAVAPGPSMQNLYRHLTGSS